MSTITTPQLLKKVPISSLPASTNNSVPYTNMTQFLEEGGFVLTKDSGFKMSKRAFGGVRRGYPDNIKFIFLHHTATRRDVGNEHIVNIFNSRAVPGESKGSTHCSIDENGSIERLFGEANMAHAQGGTGKPFNTMGMSVELTAIGYLLDTPVTHDGKVYYQQKTDHNRRYWVPKEDVAKSVDFNGDPKPYKDHIYWEKYSTAQIISTVALIKEWCVRYKIPFVFDQSAFNEMFPPKGEISKKAWNLEPGVYSHNSVKKSKSDIYPDPTLVSAFKNHFPPGNSYSKF